MVWIMLVGDRKAAFVGIHDRHKDHLGKIQPFSQQVDPNQHIEVTFTQSAENFQSLQCLHFRVQPPNTKVSAFQVPAEIFGQAFGQDGHNGAVAVGGDTSALLHQIFHLAPGGANFYGGVKETGGPNDLFHDDAIGLFKFPRPGRGRYMHDLRDQLFELLKLQGTVVHRRRESEAVIHQHLLAGVAVVHGSNLRDGRMGFINKKQPVVGVAFERESEIIEHGMGREPLGRPSSWAE